MRTPWNKGKKGVQVAWNKGTKGLTIAWNKGIKTGLVPKTAFKKGHKPSEETKEKRRIARSWYRHTKDTIEKIKLGNLGKKSPSGENHYNWKGGVDMRDKHSLFNPDYVKFRTDVFKRDQWKCRIADTNCKGQLEVHHILPWRDFVELRFKINNGITLCHAHHPRKRAEEKRLSPYFQSLVSVLN